VVVVDSGKELAELDELVGEISEFSKNVDFRDFRNVLKSIVGASVSVELLANDLMRRSKNKNLSNLAVGVMWKASELREISLTFPGVEMPPKSIAHNPIPSEEKKEEISDLYNELKDSGNKVEKEMCRQLCLLQNSKNRIEELRKKRSNKSASREKKRLESW
jgi:hypothetical protein